MKEKVIMLIKVLILLSAAIFCMAGNSVVSAAVSESLDRCLTVVIPSLYAMMIISGLLTESGTAYIISRFTGGIGRKVFGMESNVFPIFTFSMFAGYPVGVKMLCSEYTSGRITKRRAELFAGVCFGAGPSFIFGCISGRLYQSAAAGTAILFSTVSANIILALIISFFTRKECSVNERGRKFILTPEILTEAVTGGGRAILNICFTIMAFSVICSFFEYFGIISAVGGIISAYVPISSEAAGNIIPAFLDITAVGGFPTENYMLLPLLSALTSFGGVCVIFQVSAITSGKLSLRPLIFMRFFAAALSGVICRIIMPFVMKSEIISAAALKIKSHRSASPVPSVMLIIMTFCLISASNKKNVAQS